MFGLKHCESRSQTVPFGGIICEQDLKRAPAGAEELKRIMEESMKLFIPDLPITADPWCSMRWHKGLDSLRDERGRLIVQA